MSHAHFLSSYPQYATTTNIDALRSREYPLLDEQSQVYLDYTGANLFSQTQIKAHLELLQEHVFGNPHSTNPTSLQATQLVEITRNKVLEYFGASNEYYCVFTANATQSLKIIGESYPFDHHAHFLLLFDNHNSVNGIREYAKRHGATFEYAPVYMEDLRIDGKVLSQKLKAQSHKKNKLFAFPAQSNVSGVKHDLDWIAKAKDQGWDVLLDAAAYAPTSDLDLSVIKPDYVSLSFYKMFGYPTGIGALLIRKNAFAKLDKPWFAGGTVSYVSVTVPEFFLVDNQERFEEGTVNYLSIPAVKIGLDWIMQLNMEQIRTRLYALTDYLIRSLLVLKHTTGLPLIQVFGPNNMEDRGYTVIMNFFDANGEKLDISIIEHAANRQNISIRMGCFCNPGIDEINNCITSEELSLFYSSRTDVHYDKVHFLGKMRGAIRVSFGLMSNYSDCEKFIAFCRQFLS
jgi:selenocysteine lyase/cysteine desulfurase